MKDKVNVLGTEYEILFDQDLGLDTGGTFDCSSQKIRISKDLGYVDNYEKESKTLLRHELIHAFLFESGLFNNSDWATNEEMVDWFAIQFPKIAKTFKELELL